MPLYEALSGKGAQALKNTRDALYLGRGINMPIAQEGALKLKEISTIHAEGYPAGEMKHGPIALIDRDMPVVAMPPATTTLTAGKKATVKIRRMMTA